MHNRSPGSATGDVVISVKDVRKVFPIEGGGTLTALDRVSFQVKRGEVVTLTGPSGSGKSTCLRTLNGLERINEGHITLCGSDMAAAGVPEHELRRHSAMIFQHFNLFPHLNVLQNVSLAPVITRGVKRQQAHDRAMELLESVGMTSFATQYPSRLSGGQKQRVAIARALATDPKVLLCDEPTSALDPELVFEITSVLSEIARSGMTMVVVTHEMSFARQISDRCLFLEQGRLLVDKPVEEFFNTVGEEHPAESNEFRLARFLGRVERAEGSHFTK